MNDELPGNLVEHPGTCAFCGDPVLLEIDPGCPTDIMAKLVRLAICNKCADLRDYQHKRWVERQHEESEKRKAEAAERRRNNGNT